ADGAASHEVADAGSGGGREGFPFDGRLLREGEPPLEPGEGEDLAVFDLNGEGHGLVDEGTVFGKGARQREAVEEVAAPIAADASDEEDDETNPGNGRSIGGETEQDQEGADDQPGLAEGHVRPRSARARRRADREAQPRR